MSDINILENGLFEGEYAAFRKDERMQTAAGWLPWWLTSQPGEPTWKNQPPHFRQFMTEDSVSVQLVETPFGTHTAGIAQQLPAAPGDRYELIVIGRAVSSESEHSEIIEEPSDVNLQIGIDPTGGLDPTSPLVKWSNRFEPLGKSQTLRLVVEAQSTVMTVYLKSAPSKPKRQQRIFWHSAQLRPLSKYRRSVRVVGAGGTMIQLEPPHPRPGERIAVVVSSERNHIYVNLKANLPDGMEAELPPADFQEEGDQYVWRSHLTVGDAGVYDIRFVGDNGARLLAQQLLRVSSEDVLAAQAREAPSGDSRVDYRRVYVLLPPTADEWWLVAAARGAFDGRFTIGFSADDAGVGNLATRHVLAINPHHWPEPLTAAWFHKNYPGTTFTAVVANAPEDLQAWLKNWDDSLTE